MKTASKERSYGDHSGRRAALCSSKLGGCGVLSRALDPVYSRAEALAVDPGQRHLSRAFFNGVYRPGERAPDYVEPNAGVAAMRSSAAATRRRRIG